MDQVNGLMGTHLFRIGDTDVTVESMLTVMGVVLATLLLGHLARWAARRYFEKRRGEGAEASRAYGIVAQFIIWFVGFELVLHILNIRLSSILAAGGLVALAVGFAAKNLVENFLSGGILRLEKTISPGDLIVVQDQWLIVRRVSLRCLKATTYDGVEVLIPNTIVAQSTVANLTRGDRFYRIKVKVGVAYESDLAVVRAALEEAVANLEWCSKSRGPVVYLSEFGESSVNYSVRVWIDDAGESLGRRSDLHEAIWWALKEKAITIAFPQLDVHLDAPAGGEERVGA